MPKTFTAKYEGACPSCGGDVAGCEVYFDMSDRAVHAVCPPRLPKRAKALCPSCWLELPVTGVCGVCD